SRPASLVTSANQSGAADSSAGSLERGCWQPNPRIPRATSSHDAVPLCQQDLVPMRFSCAPVFGCRRSACKAVEAVGEAASSITPARIFLPLDGSPEGSGRLWKAVLHDDLSCRGNTKVMKPPGSHNRFYAGVSRHATTPPEGLASSRRMFPCFSTELFL